MVDGFDDPNLNAQFQEAFKVPTPAPVAVEAPMEMPQQGSRTNVITPEGTLENIPSEQVSEALNLGYKLATQDHVEHYEKEQKYGTLGQRVKTGLEGAASAATFGLSTGLERTAFGVKPEDIQGRREINPGTHAVGQVAGLVAPMLIPGVGEVAAGSALERAGAAGAKAIFGAEELGAAAKIGSAATKAAIENMGFQAGDENSKMLAGNPGLSAQTAITDIGLAGVIGFGIGGTLGSVNPLWKATMGSKTGGLLKAVSDKLGGIEGQVPDHVAGAVDTLGLNVAPEVKAALSQDPAIRRQFEILQGSTSKSAVEAQEALKGFKSSIGDSLTNMMGKTPEELSGLSELSENEVGSKIKDTLHKSLKDLNDPIIEKFDKIKEKFKETAVSIEDKAVLNEKIVNLAKAEGYNLSAEAAQSKLLQRVLRETPELKTLEDLRKYTSLISNEHSGIANQQMWKVSGEIRGILRDAEDQILTKDIGLFAPELLSDHVAAKASYKDLMNKIDTLNDRLHVGPYRGPGTFLKSLKEMDSKDVLSRLSPRGRVEVINELKSISPSVLEDVRGYHADSLLKMAAAKAGPHENVAVDKLIKTIEKMSPEMREFIMPGGGKKFDAIKQLMESLPSKGVSHAGVINSLESLAGSGATGLAGMLAGYLTGHNPIISGLLGMVGKTLARDVPDAARLGLLKFLGSDVPVKAEGFKAMVDYIHHASEGHNLVTKGVANIFKAGREVLPQSAMPTAAALKNLDKALKVAQTDPDSLMQTGGDIGHYMPDHNMRLAQTATMAVNYVNNQRPNTSPQAPLDKEFPINSTDKARFNRILTIAQQPLVVLDGIQKGTITPHDVATIQNMYPDLYAGLQEKITNQMITVVSKKDVIPYTTRMGLSIFLAQPMDSTMMPASISSAQPLPPPPPPDQQAPPPKHAMEGIDKLPKSYQTQGQSLESRKNRTH